LKHLDIEEAMTMDRDQFLSTLIAQYKEEIEEVLVESEHVYRSTIDYDLLHKKVEELFQAARVDGLEEKIVWDLLHARIPSYVNYVNHKRTGKKAA
jgi:murein L,D-transpeptidase YcbB/YkuD